MELLSIFKQALMISFLVFVMMLLVDIIHTATQRLIPFSVLFTTSFIQDGHGMLPMLSYSLKDSVFI